MVLILILTLPFSFFFLLFHYRFQFNNCDVSNFLELSQLINWLQRFFFDLYLPTSFTTFCKLLPFLYWVLELAENLRLILLKIHMNLRQNSCCDLQRYFWFFDWFINVPSGLPSLLLLACCFSSFLLRLSFVFFIFEYFQAPTKIPGHFFNILIRIVSWFWQIFSVFNIPIIIWFSMQDIWNTEKAQIRDLLVISFRRFDKICPIYFFCNVLLMYWNSMLIKLKSIRGMLNFFILLFLVILSYTIESR